MAQEEQESPSTFKSTTSDTGPGASYEERKIKAIDIAALLQEKYAFLSGALAKNGCLFITMPEHSKFGSLSDRDAERIFKYLVGLASSEMLQKGFMLVLDRRKEKWGAVKSCLQKVQKCFPAKISIVCLLKPQGFFQKYSKPGFVTDGIIGDAKIQVVSLGSPSDLEGYIDKSMLTEELGGTLQYKHDEWVQFRTAIERFQRNLLSFDERMKKLWQTFMGTKFSSNIFEMEQTIETQEEMWQDVKEDIVSARQAGVTLLDCITVHRKYREDSDKFTPDVKANGAELKHALTQLEILENNFSEFWKGHKAKIQYWLKVCLFEREVSQTTGLLLSALGNVSAMTDLGDSKEDAESLVNDVKKVAEKTTELLDKAKGLIAKGLKMIETNEHSKDQIKLKCDEIKELCEKFDKAVEKREEDLTKAMDIHECLDMVNKWCKTGVDLLALQPIDRFQSSEGAEKALEEIDNFLKSPQGMNMIKVKKMTPASNALGNKTMINKVKDSMKRISEVNDMMMKRETSLKKLVVKRPVQPVSGIPANPPKPEESKQKQSSTPKSPSVIPDGKRKFSMAPKSPTIKSPVMQPKERKKSTPLEPSTGRRPVSIVLDPESLQVKGSVQQSFSDPIIQTRDVVDGTRSPEAFKKRVQVMTELIKTEKDYVEDMECIIKGYLKEFEQAGSKIPAELRGKKKIIFGNIEQIYEFHKNDFLRELESSKEQPSLVGGVFIMKSNEFEMYATYCKNKPSSEALRLAYINLPFFKECQEKLGHLLPLSAYLLKPVQRITKYQLLLREMMKLTLKNSTAYDDLEKALETMEGVLRHVNDVMHSCGIKGFRGNLAEQGKLLLQDAFMVWETHKNWNLSLLPLKGGKQRQVFLYQKMIIFSKKDNDDTQKDSVTYHYKRDIKTCDMGFTEAVKGDPDKFELWLHGRSEVFVMQPLSSEVKDRWVKEIRNLMWSQFDQVKEAVTEQSGLQYPIRWKSTTSLASPGVPAENELRSRSQSTYSLSGTGTGANINTRVSNIMEGNSFDDDDGFDTEEFDSSDDNDETPLKPQSRTEDSQKTQAEHNHQDLLTKGSRYSAIASYTAVENTEVSFQEGDSLELLRVGQEGWWFARHIENAKEGWVPASYLELLSP